MSEFRDKLAALLAAEAAAAEKSGNRKAAYAEMVADLAAMLGRGIALIAGGQSDGVKGLMPFAMQYCEAEAQGAAASIREGLQTPEGSA